MRKATRFSHNGPAAFLPGSVKDERLKGRRIWCLLLLGTMPNAEMKETLAFLRLHPVAKCVCENIRASIHISAVCFIPPVPSILAGHRPATWYSPGRAL